MTKQVVSSLLMAGCIVLAVSIHDLAILLAPLALPALFFVVLFTLITQDTVSLKELARPSPEIVRAVAWQQLGIPSLVLVLAVAFSIPETLVVVVLLSATASSVFAAPAIANTLGLDRQLAVRVMMTSTLFMPISLIMFFGVYRGPGLDLDFVVYVERVALFLVAPLFLAYVLKNTPAVARLIESKSVREGCYWITIGALCVFGIGIMDAANLLLSENPLRFAILLSVALFFGASAMVVTLYAARRLGLSNAVVLSVLSSFRNTGLSYGLIGSMAGSDVSAYVGLSQLPLFLAPMLAMLIAPSSDLGGRQPSNT